MYTETSTPSEDSDNIVEIEPCITRLRCELEDGSLCDEAALSAAERTGSPLGEIVQVGRSQRGHDRRGHRGPAQSLTVQYRRYPALPGPQRCSRPRLRQIVGLNAAVTPDTAGGGEVSALAPISGTISKIHLPRLRHHQR